MPITNLEEYVESIMKEAGVWDMDPSLRASLVENLMVQVQRRIGVVAVSALDEKGMEEFTKFMAGKPTPAPDQVIAFFERTVPQFDQMLAAALKEFGDDFVTSAKRLAAKAQAVV